MLAEYFAKNYITLMMLLALLIFLLLDRKNSALHEAKFLCIAVILVFLITITETIDAYVAGIWFNALSPERAAELRAFRLYSAAGSYIMLPLTVMIEVLIIAPNKIFRFISLIPGLINAAIYASAFFGSRVAFTINEKNNFVRGPLGFFIYFTLEIYVLLLVLYSVIYFKWNNAKLSIILILIVVQTLLAAVLELHSLIGHLSAPITALCIMEYYFYLSAIYQQDMRQQVMEKEVFIAKQQMDILRSQIQPHFIFNSLSVIRALTKHDSREAVQCIDSFSEYLRAHINSLRKDELVPFEQELDNARAYLDLVQADSRKHNIEVVYDLTCTSFKIPPLTLEPIVENSIKHSIGGQGGILSIATRETDTDIYITVSDNGSPQGGMTDQETKRLGVGLDNTRKRLKMACRGSMESDFSDSGAVVTITIPKQ